MPCGIVNLCISMVYRTLGGDIVHKSCNHQPQENHQQLMMWSTLIKIMKTNLPLILLHIQVRKRKQAESEFELSFFDLCNAPYLQLNLGKTIEDTDETDVNGMYKDIEVIDLANADISGTTLIKKSPTCDVDEFFEPAAPPKTGEKYGRCKCKLCWWVLGLSMLTTSLNFEGQNTERTLILLLNPQLFNNIWNWPIIYVPF